MTYGRWYHSSGHLLFINRPPAPFVTLVCFETFVMHGTSPPHKRPHHPRET